MRRFHLFLICFVFVFQDAAQTQVPVFLSGDDGFKSYRIPAIVSSPNGDLLAFAEGRVHHAGDFGDIKIVMKRSSDKGHTWSALHIVASFDTLQAGNVAPVVDLTDPMYPDGRIFIFYNTGNNTEWNVRNGKGLREVWYKTSIDNGESWSAPVNITNQVHRPNRPQDNPVYNFKEDWRSYANTPGHAIQFESGKYKGRIFVAANHSEGNPKDKFEDYFAHGFYTDDHGKTFHLSSTVKIPGGNESTAAALSGGRLMMNSRNQQGDIRARIVSISNDGGATWDTSYFDHTLIDPVNEGSILTIGHRDGKNILAFSNDANTHQRDDLTLRISFDDGATWSKNIPVDKSADGKGDYTAYSDLVKISDHQVGILYEKNDYKEIVFSVIDWN